MAWESAGQGRSPCERGASELKLVYGDSYEALGLEAEQREKLAALGDLVRGAAFNVTGITSPEDIERRHFLDSLSLLQIEAVTLATNLVDIGSGAGFPALVLALALPCTKVTAIEARSKKCAFIEEAIRVLELPNMTVHWGRVEEYGATIGREAHEVAVSRAVGPLPVVAEYSLPLLSVGGTMVALKGATSNEERTHGLRALSILGADELAAVRLSPFPEAENRWAYVAKKLRRTPGEYPRRPGIPAKRPLGQL